MLLKPTCYDGSLQRQLTFGDTLAQGEQLRANDATNALTVTGQILLAAGVIRTPTAAATDTIDTAANIIAAISAGMGTSGIPAGTTWRTRWINLAGSTFTCTLTATANTGITVNRGLVAITSAKDFLVTVNNGTPAQTYQMNTTNASAVVTGLTQTQAATLTPGMVVTNAVNGLQGQTILAVNVSAGSVTLSGNANATSTTPVAISFSPVITIDGLAP